MIGETYLFKDLYDGKKFMFISSGSKGDIVKQVIFEKLKPDFYNLGFGDFIGYRVSDSVVSNNNDLQKVMNTIGAIIYQFFEINPTATISIIPVDDKRSRLYHTIFKRRIHEINRIFVLEGLNNEEWNIYETDKVYQEFKISKKDS